MARWFAIGIFDVPVSRVNTDSGEVQMVTLENAMDAFSAERERCARICETLDLNSKETLLGEAVEKIRSGFPVAG